MDQEKFTTHKAWASAITTFITIGLALAGSGQMPDPSKINEAIMTVAFAVGSAVASWVVTYFVTNKKKAPKEDKA